MIWCPCLIEAFIWGYNNTNHCTPLDRFHTDKKDPSFLHNLLAKYNNLMCFNTGHGQADRKECLLVD